LPGGKENAIIRKKEFDLQLFASPKDPKKQVEEYVERWGKDPPDPDPRIRHYSPDAVKKALYYYKKNLKEGIIAPDGFKVNVTERDFYKHIADYVFVRQPELIKEIVQNADIKVRQKTEGMYIFPGNLLATS
jgi:hypothetical protein